MSELTFTLLRLGYLVLLWVFVLSAVAVLRRDLAGPRTTSGRRRRSAARHARPSGVARRGSSWWQARSRGPPSPSPRPVCSSGAHPAAPSCWTTTTRRRVTRGSSPRAVSGSWRIWAPRTARTSARSGCRASSRSPPVSACRSDSPSSSSRDDHHVTVTLRYAARSDVGLVRSNNQDSAYAGPNLLVV